MADKIDENLTGFFMPKIMCPPKILSAEIFCRLKVYPIRYAGPRYVIVIDVMN